MFAMRHCNSLPVVRGRLSFSHQGACSMAPRRPVCTHATVGNPASIVDLAVLTEACAALVSRAGSRIRAVHSKRLAGATLRVDYKDESDPRSALTEADAAAQAAIVPALRATFPGIAVIGEEEEESDDDDSTSDALKIEEVSSLFLGTVAAADVTVFVDPVDGTREFVNGNLPAVQTLAGICVRGRPVSGVISIPFAKSAPVIIAAVGSGVRGLETIPPPQPRLGEGVVLTASKDPVGVVAAVQTIVAPTHRLEMGGAGNKMLRVATGEADIAVLNLVTSLWDSAATEALVVATGGTVTDFFGCRLVHTSTACLTNFYGVIATGPNFTQRDSRHRTHRELCAEIRAAMTADPLLARAGFIPQEFPQATDVARDLDGELLSLDFLRSVVSPRISGFAAPEHTAVRYLMSDACRVELHYKPVRKTAEQEPDTPKSVFVKRVVMEDLPHVQLKARTAPEKLARDVTSYQVEAAFLGSRACARLVAAGARVARPFHVEQRPAPSGAPPIQSRFLLVLEDFASSDGWAQYGLLEAAQLRACLAALAELHAFFWNFADDPDAPQLEEAVWPQASYWVPSRQAKDSFEKLPKCWKAQLAAFKDPLAKTKAAHEDRMFPLEQLGEVLQRYAEHVAVKVHFVGTNVQHKWRTILHGDAKAANFFLRESGTVGDEWAVGLIDFQWSGWGHPGLDVAYLIATSAEANNLSRDGVAEREFIAFYHERLKDSLVRFGKTEDHAEAGQHLPIEDLYAFYDDAILDLARLVVSYHWDRIKASPEVLVSRKDNIGSNSYNKDVDCAVWFIERTWALLSDLEAASRETQEGF